MTRLPGTLFVLLALTMGVEPALAQEENPFGGDWPASKARQGPTRTTHGRPNPEDPNAVIWSYGDWTWAITGSAAGLTAGVMGGPKLGWWALGLCPSDAKTWDCVDDNLGATIFFGLSGGILGGATGAWVVGRALGYEGTWMGGLAGAAAGGLVFLTGFSPYVPIETSLLVSSVVTMVAIPIGAAMGFYLSQDRAVRIGEGMKSSSGPILRVTPTAAMLEWSF